MTFNYLSGEQTGLASGVSQTFYHGLGRGPDIVLHQWVGEVSPYVSAECDLTVISQNATTFTVRNFGTVTTPNFKLVAHAFHPVVK